MEGEVRWQIGSQKYKILCNKGGIRRVSIQLSICVPTYNRKRNLSELLDALAELIGVDCPKTQKPILKVEDSAQ